MEVLLYAELKVSPHESSIDSTTGQQIPRTLLHVVDQERLELGNFDGTVEIVLVEAWYFVIDHLFFSRRVKPSIFISSSLQPAKMTNSEAYSPSMFWRRSPRSQI